MPWLKVTESLGETMFRMSSDIGRLHTASATYPTLSVELVAMQGCADASFIDTLFLHQLAHEGWIRNGTAHSGLRLAFLLFDIPSTFKDRTDRLVIDGWLRDHSWTGPICVLIEPSLKLCLHFSHTLLVCLIDDLVKV